MLGSDLILYIKVDDWTLGFSYYQYRHFYICLFITLVGILWGYVSTKTSKKLLKITDDPNLLNSFGKLLKVLCCLAALVYFYFLMERISFVTSKGYGLYYLDFEYSSSVLKSISDKSETDIKEMAEYITKITVECAEWGIDIPFYDNDYNF